MLVVDERGRDQEDRRTRTRRRRRRASADARPSGRARSADATARRRRIRRGPRRPRTSPSESCSDAATSLLPAPGGPVMTTARTLSNHGRTAWPAGTRLPVRPGTNHAALQMTGGTQTTATATAGGGSSSAFADPSLRAWQRRALGAAEGWRSGPFLIAAAPGAGKTRPSLVLARELLRRGEIDRVAIVCPTAPLTRQWAAAAARPGPPAAARRRQPADDSRLPGDRRHLRPGRRLGGDLRARVRPADAGHRRRGPPPRRRARLGRGLHEGVRRRRPQAPALGDAVPERRRPDPRHLLRRLRVRRARHRLLLRGGDPRRRLPARSSSSPSTAPSSGRAATTRSRARSPRSCRPASAGAATGRRSRPSCRRDCRGSSARPTSS